jgi:hypothetical protein
VRIARHVQFAHVLTKPGATGDSLDRFRGAEPGDAIKIQFTSGTTGSLRATRPTTRRQQQYFRHLKIRLTVDDRLRPVAHHASASMR